MKPGDVIIKTWQDLYVRKELGDISFAAITKSTISKRVRKLVIKKDVRRGQGDEKDSLSEELRLDPRAVKIVIDIFNFHGIIET